MVKRKSTYIFVLTCSLASAALAFAQTLSSRTHPVKQVPLNASAREGQREPLATHPPRFRGWRHTPPALAPSYTRRSVSSSTGKFSTASRHRLNASSQAQLSFNGFGFRPSLPTGQVPTAVAAADFNGDGKLDWAVSNGLDNTIWLYFGNGDGTAALPSILPTAGLAPIRLIATDLNGDGKPDLVVTEADSSTVGVFLGNGDGTFQAEVQYSVPAAPLFLVAGDFNGDGKTDIAVGMVGSTSTGAVAVLPGDGLGHLGAALYTPDPNASVGYWLTAAVLRTNGMLDLIVVDPDDFGAHGGAQIYLNNGNGTFTPGQLFFTNQVLPNIPPDLALSTAVADLNNDGCGDVVMTDSYGIAYVYSGNCSGTVATPPTQYAVGDMAVTVQLEDVNGDGILDMVTSGAYLSGTGGLGLGDVAGDEVSILLGDGTGHFGLGRTYRGDMDMYSLAIGDVNGDGFPDLITANQGSDTATVFLNDGKGGFGDPQGEAFGNNEGATDNPNSPFAFADVDGNGTLDMVLLDDPPYPGSPEQITTFLNDGTGKFSTPIITPAWQAYTIIPGSLTLADFRNTGHPDLLVLANTYGSPFIAFAPNIGGGQFGPYTMTTLSGANAPMAVGDFNGDGKLDFVTATTGVSANNYAQQLNVLLGNGDGTFEVGQSITFETGNGRAAPQQLFVGDFNRDGKLDVLVWDGGLYEFFGNGDGTFQAGIPLFASFGGGLVMVDFNKDGWPDIMTATDVYGNATDSMFSVFLGQPDGSFKYAESYPPFPYSFDGPILFHPYVPLSTFPGIVGDFNGDGNPDVAVFPNVAGTLADIATMQIFYGNGDGTFTPTYVSYPFAKPYVPEFAADLNGDGLSDLIELDDYTPSFNVVKARAAGPTLQLDLLTTPLTGTTGTGRVILNAPSASATSVSFTASDPAIAVPSVVIPAGAISQDFQFSTGGGFNQQKVFSIQAQVGSAMASAYDYFAAPPTPVIEFEPAKLLFTGLVYPGGSSVQPVTVKNVGAGTLTISALEVLSPWFSQTNNCGSNLSPGASCTIQVTFTSPFPGDASGGGMTLYDNIANMSETVPLEGLSIWSLQITPCCLGFSEVVGGTSSQQTVTLSNVGTTAIQVNSIVASGAGIAETNNCNTVSPNGSCKVQVTFSPSSGGAVTGMLTVNTNLPSSGLIIPVSGNARDFSLGSAASVTISPGQKATYNLSATSSFGFTGNLALSCSGAPSGSQCTINPTSVSLEVDGSASYTMTVATTASSGAALSAGRSLTNVKFSFALLAISFLLLSFSCGIRKRFRKTLPVGCGVLCLVFSIASCGGGSNGGGGGGGGGQGTLPGTYTLTISGTAGSVAHTTSVTLVVQ